MMRHRHRHAGRAISRGRRREYWASRSPGAPRAPSRAPRPASRKNAIKLGFIWSGTGVAAPELRGLGQRVPGARRRPERQGRRERSQDRARDGRRQVVRRQPHRGEGPGREPPRVRGRQQLVVRVPRRTATSRLRHAADRRRLRRELLQPEGQRGHHQRGRQRQPSADRHHLHQRHRRGEEARRHEDRLGRLRRVAVVDRRRQGHAEVRRTGLGARSRCT